MLQPGERIDNHDRICCEYYASLLALGAYDEEFMLFGVAYFEEGKSKCYISPNRQKVYNFVQQCRERMVYPSIVESRVKRCRVHSGDKEKIEQAFKIEFACDLKKKYPQEFLKRIQEIAICPINNRATEILNPLQDSLEGCFDEDALQLYEHAVDFAYDGKILTSMDYYSNKKWLALEKDFLTEKLNPAANLKRTMAGFGYIQNGSVRYYTNALREKTLERHMEIMAEGLLTSPIFYKDYYLNGYNELQYYIEEFDASIKKIIDENYMMLIEDLYNIRPEINAYKFHELVNSIDGIDKGKKKTCRYYEILWHLK